MILTVTPNPTIDRVLLVDGFCWNAAVRAEREVITPSGKGVDSSLVIQALGGQTVALGLSAGFTGLIHESLLDEWGIHHDFVPAAGETRTAVVLVDRSQDRQSTISASTLTATEDHPSLLLDGLDRYAERAWGLICGGSLPPGLPTDTYTRLLRHARWLGLTTLLDSSGEALCNGVAGLPHILKINQDELVSLDASAGNCPPDAAARGSERTEHDVGSSNRSLPAHSVFTLARRLAKRLGRWASDALVVTLGGQGALAVTGEGSFHAVPPAVPVVNTAGAGDALNGMLMLRRSEGSDWPTALAAGTAAAASVIMTEGTAFCEQRQFEQLVPRVKVLKLSP
jgi:1-phosphofructokinase family hexose kinase